MAYISKAIHLENGEYPYEAYVNANGDVFMMESGDETCLNFIVIKKEEWKEFKNFIDAQLKAYGKGE